MNIMEIVLKKQIGKILKEEEISYVVNNYTNNIINDSDMTLFLKAICKKGMTDKETIYLTKAMLNSGPILDLSMIDGVKVDKHSTGGVGDKTTLIVAPIVAACNVYIAKMSGRALGFTGGTIDKLESIKGFKVNLSKDEFIRELIDIKMAVTSQTEDIAIADKKIYALRDITDTVSSIPLIASSIMSKKLATGADIIVLDVKVGNGALMNNLHDAKLLAKLMIKIGKSFNKKIIAVISNMNEPLGHNIGNALEVEEAIKILNNNGDEDLKTLCKELATNMIMLAKSIPHKDAMQEVEEVLKSRKAYQKFLEFIKYQGGELFLPKANNKTIINSLETGYVESINSKLLGEYVMSLGAGRKNKTDQIDYTVGIKVIKKIGDYASKDEPIFEIYSNKLDIPIFPLNDIVNINNKLVEKEPIIIKIIK